MEDTKVRSRVSVDDKGKAKAAAVPRHLAAPEGVFGKVLDGDILDPTKPTFLATLSPGWTLCGRVDGQWCPGQGWPFYGPGGDQANMVGKFHRFACVLVSYDQATSQVLDAVEDDAQCGFAVTNGTEKNIFVAAVMNDDNLGDNTNNAQNPMRWTKQFEGPGNCPDC